MYIFHRTLRPSVQQQYWPLSVCAGHYNLRHDLRIYTMMSSGKLWTRFTWMLDVLLQMVHHSWPVGLFVCCSHQLAVVMWLLTYVGAVFNGITILILGKIFGNQDSRHIQHVSEKVDHSVLPSFIFTLLYHLIISFKIISISTSKANVRWKTAPRDCSMNS